MKKITKILSAFLILIVSLFIINSCSKDDISGTGGTGGNGLKTTICGIVLDENNSPQSGVSVSAYGQTTETNLYGIFIFENLGVSKDRCIMQFSKAGFFNRAHAFIASANTVNYVRIVLISNAQTQTILSSSGGSVTLADNASVQFQPNSFVTAAGSSYTGTVSVAVKHLSPDDTNFGFSIPGGDLAARDANDKDVVLYSYGMLGVLLTGSSGETLQLAGGTTATLTMPVAASQIGTAPSTIPLWYFDETSSLWKQLGTASKIGNNYVGTVTHFSWWNCDYPGLRASIKGKVLDCQGNPIQNIQVTVNGCYTTTTDQNGVYQGNVPVGMLLTTQVLAGNNSGILIESQIENIPVLTEGEIFTVPDLIVPCPTRITGTISGCNGIHTNAVVFITWSGGVNFQYSTKGNFDIAATANSQVTIKIYEGSTTVVKSITSGPAEFVTDIGNTVLCSNGVQPYNSFYIDGSGYNHELIQIDTTITYAAYASGGTTGNGLNIYCSGFNHSTGESAHFTFNLNDSLPGDYSCNSSGINSANIGFDSKSFVSFSQNAQTTVTLSEVQYVGGRVKGTFYGTLSNDTSITSPNVTISSGKFDVTRIQ